MSDQPAEQRPSDATIIRIQKTEIDRLNDNRIFLIASIEELQADALVQIAARDQEIEELRAASTNVETN